jgi:tetratricopeptide (TPR) repeat protein
LYSAKGDYAAALAYYNKALQARPLLYDALLNKSAVYYNMRNIDSAFATIRKIHSPRYRAGKRYGEILNEILYSKAYFIAEKLPEEDQKKFLEKIENPSWLNMCFEPTLSGNSPFDSTLIHNFEIAK